MTWLTCSVGRPRFVLLRLQNPVGPGQKLSKHVRNVIGLSKSNSYVVSAPVAQSNFTCSPSNLTFSTPIPLYTNADTSIISVNVTSPTCPTSAFNIPLPAVIHTGVLLCPTNGSTIAQIEFFTYLNPPNSTAAPLYLPLASCSGSVQVGDVDGITYSDSQLGLQGAYTLPNTTLRNLADFSTPSLYMLAYWWLGSVKTSSFIGHSEALDWLLSDTVLERQGLPLLETIRRQNVSDADFYETFQIIVEGLTAMTAAKLVNAVTFELDYYKADVAGTVVTIPYNSTVLSQAIFIGPDGWNKLVRRICYSLLLVNADFFPAS